MSFWVAGAALVGSVYSADKAGDSAAVGNAQSAESLQIQRDTLQFTQDQYTDWKNIYGGVEQNLASFYDNLTPEYIESQGLQAQQSQYQTQQQELTQYFAANNIESGVQADIFSKGSFENARAKAQISADAEFKTMDQKANFLNLGLGSKGSTIDRVSTAGTNLATSLSSLSSQNYNQAQQGYASSGSMLSDAIKAIATADQGESEL